MDMYFSVEIRIRELIFSYCVEIIIKTGSQSNIKEMMAIEIAIRLIEISEEYGGRPNEQEPSHHALKNTGVSFGILFPKETENNKEENYIQYIKLVKRIFSS